MKKEFWIILFGGIVAVVGISVPFLIMYFTDQAFVLSNFQNLGVIGDYFGGTTVGLLSLASIIFVTAAIIMQKEELELQRIEVRKTREEYEITNTTMKKQQFDSIFFNMINLHNNIQNDLKLNRVNGREVIEEIYSVLCIKYSELVKADLLNNNISLLDEFVKETYIDKNLEDYRRNAFKTFGSDPLLNSKYKDYSEFDQTVCNGTSNEWKLKKKELLQYYEEDKSINSTYFYKDHLDDMNLEELLKKNSNVYRKIKDKYYQNPSKELKTRVYETLYKEYENIFGHYYSNLYRLVKLIQEQNFDNNEVVNEKEKSKYRGILRAQFSSFELLMLFYNISLSEKGEKFKRLLISTNFFDDYLIKDYFIWENDEEELAKLDS